MTWETSLMHTLAAHASPALDHLMAAVTVLAPIVVGAAVAHEARQDRRREAWVLAAALVGSVILSLELQFMLLRPRPEVTAGLLPPIPTPSFPSGHAAFTAALATFYTLARRRAAALGAAAFAALVMLSRVWVGHHYPSDVLVGAVVGVCVTALLFGAHLAEPDARPRWAWWIWPQLAVVVLASASAYLGLSQFDWLAVPGADKALHFLLFGLLAFFVVGWLARYPATSVLLGVSVLCIVDEALQALSPARTFDLVDLACTLAGVLVFGLLARRQVHALGAR